MEECKEQIEIALIYYFKHVVSEIKEFYPDEYDMLELLASGQQQDFMELSQISEFVQHLYSYGLIAKNENGLPYITMPVAARYVAIELAQREGRKSVYKLIDPQKRKERIYQYCTSIIRDMRQLEKSIISANLPSLFGVNSFAEADSFITIEPVDSQVTFNTFINICNRCFVESIENHGKDKGISKYFWSDIKTNYGALFVSLHKIKVYRHDADHLFLNNQTNQNLKAFLGEDLPDDIPSYERYYCLQQKVLEDLLTNIQVELNKLN